MQSEADNSARAAKLRGWGVPTQIIALTLEQFPHPIFQRLCEPLKSESLLLAHQWQLQGFELFNGSPSVTLWENDLGDGHAFDIFFAVKANEQIEYWRVQYADDMPEPETTKIARSAQGLFFWLFFSLLPLVYFLEKTNANALRTIRQAAESVGFRYLEELMTLEEEISSELNFSELLAERALQIPQ